MIGGSLRKMQKPTLWLVQPVIWLQWLIPFGVLAACALLPFLGLSDQLIFLAIVLLAGIGAIVIFTRWPVIGLLSALAGGMFIPIAGPSGLSVTFIIMALMFALWLLNLMLSRRSIYLAGLQPTRPLLAFLAVSAIALGWGNLPWFSWAPPAPLGAQVGGFGIIALSVGAFIMAGRQLTDIRWLQIFTWGFLLLAAPYVLLRAIPGMGVFSSFYLPGATGSLFWAWLIVIAFSQAVINDTLQRRVRIALGGLIVIGFYVAIVQGYDWKSGWAPAVIGVAIIVALRSLRATVLMGLLAAIFALDFVYDALASDDYSISTRFDAWIIMGEIIKVNPLLGLGFANYSWYTPFFPIRGYAVKFNSHNQYIDIIAQTGVVGFLCFVWFIWEIGWLGLRMRNWAPAGFAQAYVYGCLGGLAATVAAGILGDWILPYFYNVGMKGFPSSVLSWIFLGGLVALQQNIKNQGSNNQAILTTHSSSQEMQSI